MTPEQIRTAFERWMTSDGQWQSAVVRAGDGYKLMQVNLSWVAWKAAFAAMKEAK